MAQRKLRRTEMTAKGLEVPIRKRGEFFANLKKAVKPEKPLATHRPKQ